MNDIIEALNKRIKELTQARDLILGAEPTITTAFPPPKASKRRRTRTSPGEARAAVLAQLRTNGGMSFLELTRALEAGKFKFAPSSNHKRCVQGALRNLGRSNTVEHSYIPGRGIVHALKRHREIELPGLDPVEKAAPQRGLSDKIVAVLAGDVLPHGHGFTAVEIIEWLKGEGYIFYSINPQKSVTGLLSSLTKRGIVTRQKAIESPYAYRYKAAPTSELVVTAEDS